MDPFISIKVCCTSPNFNVTESQVRKHTLRYVYRFLVYVLQNLNSTLGEKEVPVSTKTETSIERLFRFSVENPRSVFTFKISSWIQKFVQDGRKFVSTNMPRFQDKGHTLEHIVKMLMGPKVAKTLSSVCLNYTHTYYWRTALYLRWMFSNLSRCCFISFLKQSNRFCLD